MRFSGLRSAQVLLVEARKEAALGSPFACTPSRAWIGFHSYPANSFPSSLDACLNKYFNRKKISD